MTRLGAPRENYARRAAPRAARHAAAAVGEPRARHRPRRAWQQPAGARLDPTRPAGGRRVREGSGELSAYSPEALDL